MNSSEKSVFINLFLRIAELYNTQLSYSMLEIYWNIFKKYPLHKIHDAINFHLLNHEAGKFMPKPADLLKHLEPNAEELALNAWSSVIHAIKTVGSQGGLTFSDPLIYVVIDDMGGWRKFCEMQNFQVPYFAKEFQHRYLNYQRLNLQIPIRTISSIYSDTKPILIQSHYQPTSTQEKLS
jgi:hypothetical protein